jgi:hypothetical protein
MTSKLGGRPTKDAPITDSFNTSKLNVKNKDIRAAKRQERLAKMRVDQVKEKTGEMLDAAAQLAQEEIEKVKKQVGIKSTKPTSLPDEEPDETPPDPDEDEKSAYKMLQDLRYAYRKAKGPTGKSGKMRLLELMADDKEFKYMVKQLLSIESSLMAAKMRKGEEPGGVGQQNFFVILKGLEDEKKVMGGLVDKAVDMKQIERAINPTDDGSWQQEEEVERNAAPEQLSKVNDTEDW